MKKNIFMVSASIIMFLFSLTIMIGLTFGWFAKAVVVPKGEISSGDLTYVLAGELIDEQIIIVPGLELVEEPFTLVNTSSIPSQLRMRISYLAYVRVGIDVVEQELSYQGDSTDFLFIELGPHFERTGNYWYYNEDPLLDGTLFIIEENSGLMTLFTSIIYDGTLTGIDFASQEIYIMITVEVKQAKNVTWSELVNINFQTGKPI
jgi:hypothetical protein